MSDRKQDQLVWRLRQTCQRSCPAISGIESATVASSMRAKFGASSASSCPGRMPKGRPFGWSQMKKQLVTTQL